MAQEDIPEHVLRFIVDHIDTVPHIEALLLLWENPTRAWTEEEVGERVYVGAERAAALLQDLLRRRLVCTESAHPTRYRYDPAWDPSGELMRDVATTYRRRLVQVANLIHSKASQAVLEFARAFQFKNER